MSTGKQAKAINSRIAVLCVGCPVCWLSCVYNWSSRKTCLQSPSLWWSHLTTCASRALNVHFGTAKVCREIWGWSSLGAPAAPVFRRFCSSPEWGWLRRGYQARGKWAVAALVLLKFQGNFAVSFTKKKHSSIRSSLIPIKQIFFSKHSAVSGAYKRTIYSM